MCDHHNLGDEVDDDGDGDDDDGDVDNDGDCDYDDNVDFFGGSNDFLINLAIFFVEGQGGGVVGDFTFIQWQSLKSGYAAWRRTKGAGKVLIVYSNFRKYAHPLHVKEGIITEKVFPVFSKSFF